MPKIDKIVLICAFVLLGGTALVTLVTLVTSVSNRMDTPDDAGFIEQCRETCVASDLMFMGVELANDNRCVCISEEGMYPE